MNIKYKIYRKETLYFTLMAIISLILYAMLIGPTVILGAWLDIPVNSKIIGEYLVLAAGLWAFQLFIHTLFIGYLRGNSVMATEQQFPEIYNIVKSQAAELDIQTPKIYVQQAGGMLNAFATRFFGRNYIILYSDILEAAYDEGIDAVKFIIGHELGHIKRGHLNPWLRLLILPAQFMPFLAKAYSRNAEYNCDNIAYSLAPTGAEPALLILSAGTKLYKKINIAEHLKVYNTQSGFATCFAEVLSTHPHLANRILSLRS